MAVSTKTFNVVRGTDNYEIKIDSNPNATVNDPISISSRYLPADGSILSFGTICNFYLYPTGNCQLGSLAMFNSLVDYGYSVALTILQELQKSTLKNMWLLDIQTTYLKDLQAILGKENLMMQQEYVSTRGTNMCIILFRTENLLTRKL